MLHSPADRQLAAQVGRALRPSLLLSTACMQSSRQGRAGQGMAQPITCGHVKAIEAKYMTIADCRQQTIERPLQNFPACAAEFKLILYAFIK